MLQVYIPVGVISVVFFFVSRIIYRMIDEIWNSYIAIMAIAQSSICFNLTPLKGFLA